MVTDGQDEGMTRVVLPSWRFLHALALLSLCTIMPPVVDADPGDDQLIIYRCTNVHGQLSLRDTPCLPGDQQQMTEMQRPQDPSSPPAGLPARGDAPVETTAAPPAPPTPPTQPHRVAPAASYRCITPDGERYTSASADGNPRWVPLWTLGYYPVIVSPGHGHHPGRYPPSVRPAGAAAYAGSRAQPTLDSSPRFVFDSVGRPSPKPPYDGPGVPDRLPGQGVMQGPGTWIRDSCTHIPQAEVCNELRERHSTLSGRYNSALQSERREIDNEKRRIDDRLTSECTP